MHNNVTYPLLRCTLGYTNDQHLHHVVPPHDTWRSCELTNISTWVSSIVLLGVCLCYTVVYKLTKVYTKATQLKNISLPTCILKCKTTISSIPMCYTKCHNVNFHFKELLIFTKNIVLIINGCDTRYDKRCNELKLGWMNKPTFLH